MSRRPTRAASTSKQAVAHFDGGARPCNPGYGAFAVVLELDGRQHLFSRYLGSRVTNNVAEHKGCLMAIKFAIHLEATELFLISDSKLVVNQVLGNWAVRDPILKPLVAESQALLDRHYEGYWSLEWCPRERNADADELCTQAISYGRNLNPWIPERIKQTRPGRVIDPFHPA